MAVESMLTTIDNPHDPFDDYDAWLGFDTAHGYNTLGYLARIVITSYELSEADESLAIERAIDEIIYFNVNGMFKRVTREVVDNEADPSSN